MRSDNNSKSDLQRTAHSSVIIENKIYIFGGFSHQKTFFNDLACLTLSEETFSRESKSHHLEATY